MRISQQKTQFISPNCNETWSISNCKTHEHFEIKAVTHYHYLGIDQYKSLVQTADQRAELALLKLQSYRKIMNLKKYHMADTIESYVVSWKNILLPSALYGVEVLPWTGKQIRELELEQNKFAKAVLSVPCSSANACVQALLGLKSIKQLVIEARIRMIKKLQVAEQESILKEIWDAMIMNNRNMLWNRLEQLLTEEGITEPLQTISIADVNKHFESKTRKDLVEMKTMQWITVPRIMWKMKKFIIDADWARAYVQFLTQNAGLGNRTNKLQSFGSSDEAGKIIICPLCAGGFNDEKHLVLKCPKMINVRREYKLLENTSMQDWIDQRTNTDDNETMREFFGGLRQEITYYMDRGLFLMALRQEFFNKWSDRCGETVQCSLD